MFVERVLFTRKRPGKTGWEPRYEWMPEIKDWYIPANRAREKLEDIVSRGTTEIPGVFFKQGKYGFVTKKFTPWLVHEFLIIKWLKKQGCRIPDGLENFLKKWEGKEPASQTQKTQKSNKGRPEFPYSARFASEVVKLHDDGVSKKLIPYRATITQILNPDAANQGKEIGEKEYKKIYGHARSTVYTYAVKAINESKQASQ